MVLKIQDDGRGFNSKRSPDARVKGHGLGLSNMRERAMSLDGTCEIQSGPGKGTTILVRVPLAEDKRNAGAKREAAG